MAEVRIKYRAFAEREAEAIGIEGMVRGRAVNDRTVGQAGDKFIRKPLCTLRLSAFAILGRYVVLKNISCVLDVHGIGMMK